MRARLQSLTNVGWLLRFSGWHFNRLGPILGLFFLGHFQGCFLGHLLSSWIRNGTTALKEPEKGAEMFKVVILCMVLGPILGNFFRQKNPDSYWNATQVHISMRQVRSMTTAKIMLLCLSLQGSSASDLANFFARQKVAIQNYIMAGYGDGWKGWGVTVYLYTGSRNWSNYSSEVPCLKVTGTVTKFLLKSDFPVPANSFFVHLPECKERRRPREWVTEWRTENWIFDRGRN